LTNTNEILYSEEARMTSPIPILADVPELQQDAGFGALGTPMGNLPLKALDVSARIDGLLARTVVRQRFANPHAEPLEATYVFPLPDRAAVNRFVMRVGPRTIEGELQERGKAREAYEQALKAGRRAAIAEEERPDVFTMRVGNLPPGESIDVELTLTGPLPVDHGEATFRFPLVVAPRYIPGKPLEGESVGDGTHVDTDQVPDASRITPPVLLPGQPSPVQLTLSVEVHPGSLRVSDFRSSLHTVSEGEANCALHFALKPGERLDRDFILRFRVDDVQLRASLQFQPDADDPAAGTFALTLVPPRASAGIEKPRDVVFVLDRSGSMDGWKMIAARRALGRMIDSLTDRDRFAVLAFDDNINSFPENRTIQAATDRQRYRAVEWLARVESRGGTEMASPLLMSLSLLEEAKNDRVLVLITDGQVGNEDHLLRTLTGKLEGVRIFTLGIDQAVNAGFLKRLAGLGGGYCEHVESEDRLDAVMDKVHRRIRAPLLFGVKIEPAGLAFEPDSLVPTRLPDLFPGTPLTILGRYRRGEQLPGVCVQATDDAGRPWSETVRAAQGEVLAPVWARGRLRDLEDHYATALGDRPALEQQIVATSLKFNVLCRFTAFVAVDVQEVVNPGGQVRRVTQPVEAPAGWDMLKHEAFRSRAMAAGSSSLCLGAPSKSARVESVDSMLMDFDGDRCSALAALPEDIGLAASRRIAPASSRKIKSAAPPPAPAAIDLTAYRKRADELRQRLESTADPLRELGVVRLKLEELLDDLRSTGAADAGLRPLAELLAELQAFLAAPGDVATMVKRCGEVLSAFAGGTKPMRRGWWK
jgi:Ca-activated chloride channel family protein